MLTNRAVCVRLCAMLFILLYSSVTFGGPAKVEVCHIPPGNPDNYHTIKISEKALAKHLAHGDLAGACNSLCATLCDDGDACTIDDTGDCETAGCPTTPEPTDCSTDDLCSLGSCDSDTGCVEEPVMCGEPENACVVRACDGMTGTCQDAPVSCSIGEECNVDTGLCEDIVDPVDPDACPCFSAEDLDNFGTPISCFEEAGNLLGLYPFDGGTIACTGDSCVATGSPGCYVENTAGTFENPDITAVQNTNCRDLITASCP